MRRFFRWGLEMRMSVILNISYCFDAIPNKISASCYLYTDKLILKFIWKGRQQRIAHTVLMEENRVGGLRVPSSALSTAESIWGYFLKEEMSRLMEQNGNLPI